MDPHRRLLSATALVAAAIVPSAGRAQAAAAGHARPAAAAVDARPAWSAADRRALETALEHRDRHGLDRLTFLADDAASLAPADRDAAYRRAALAYARALAGGAVDPSSLHEVYTVVRPVMDVPTGLAGAIRAHRLAAWLDGLAPRDAEYRQLSAAYLAAGERPAHDAPPIAVQASVHPGERDPSIPRITGQLIDDGYLAATPSGATADAYAPPVVEAVKALQRDYGIQEDGIIGSDTLGVMNLRAGDRARALAVALERRRWLPRTPPPTRIDVNTAAAVLHYYRDGRLVDTRKVVVGEPDRGTPSLQSPIYRLVANPTWTVPRSIQNTELAHVGPAYLRAHAMRMQGGWIVQQPGPGNALGLVKFDMRNDQAIYLHDTSAPALFARSQRHLSHGCVRVEDALGFAAMLADEQGVGDAWRQAHASGDYTIVDLPREVPVRLLYHNVFVDGDGAVAFRTDPYGWNEAVAEKLGFTGGDAKRAQAEAIDLGP